jgi:spermidine/putrescine-binding protein
MYKEKEKKELLKILTKSLGVISTACTKANIDRGTFYNWYNNDEDFRKEVDDIQEIVLDFAESKLYSKIDEGDTTATIFYLKCKGKKRGYIDKVENHNVNVNYEVDENLTEEELKAKIEQFKKVVS